MNLAWATAADAAALAQVHATGFAAPWTEPEIAQLLEGPGVFGFLAGREPPVGMILCRVVEEDAEILTLAVAPQARRRGIALALVRASVEASRQAGATAVFLEVAVDNGAAASLYAGAGFRRAGQRTGYYDRGEAGRVDALVMRLDLNGEAASPYP